MTKASKLVYVTLPVPSQMLLKTNPWTAHVSSETMAYYSTAALMS